MDIEDKVFLDKLSSEKVTVANNMIAYGGGFVSKLGEALAVADFDNTLRIKKAFPEYWDKYLSMKIGGR